MCIYILYKYIYPPMLLSFLSNAILFVWLCVRGPLKCVPSVARWNESPMELVARPQDTRKQMPGKEWLQLGATVTTWCNQMHCMSTGHGEADAWNVGKVIRQIQHRNLTPTTLWGQKWVSTHAAYWNHICPNTPEPTITKSIRIPQIFWFQIVCHI